MADVKTFEKKLKNNEYNSVGGARKALGRLGLDDKAKAKLDAVVVKHFEGPADGAEAAAADAPPAKVTPPAKKAAKESKSDQLALPFSPTVTTGLQLYFAARAEFNFHQHAASSFAQAVYTLTDAKAKYPQLDIGVVDHVLMPALEDAAGRAVAAYNASCRQQEEAAPVAEAKTSLGRLQSGARKPPPAAETDDSEE